MVNAKVMLIFQNLYAEIYCRDCLRTSCSLFHVLGIKCKHCKGYNTVRERGPLMRKQGENDCESANSIDKYLARSDVVLVSFVKCLLKCLCALKCQLQFTVK